MICPYCDDKFDYCDDEPAGEGVVEEAECTNCEKKFTFSRCYSISYHTNKADCLNGAGHTFEEACRMPRVVAGKTLWRCTGCNREENRQADCTHGGAYCLVC